MRGLEKLEASPLLERDLAVRQLDLEIGGHVARTDEDRDLSERRPVLVQLEDAVDDEARLLLLVSCGDEPRRFVAGALGPEALREPLERAGDERVRDVEDRLGRAVILLERDDCRVRKLAR